MRRKQQSLLNGGYNVTRRKKWNEAGEKGGLSLRITVQVSLGALSGFVLQLIKLNK